MQNCLTLLQVNEYRTTIIAKARACNNSLSFQNVPLGVIIKSVCPPLHHLLSRIDVLSVIVCPAHRAIASIRSHLTHLVDRIHCCKTI